MNVLDLLHMLATVAAIVGTIVGAHRVMTVRPSGKRWPAFALIFGLLVAVIVIPGVLGIVVGLGYGPGTLASRAILLASVLAVIVASAALRMRYRPG